MPLEAEPSETSEPSESRLMLLDLPSNRAEAWRWSDLSALPALADAAPTGRVPDVAALDRGRA